MQAISLLILVILVSLLINKKSASYARVIIGSVFGVFFFVVWPLQVYYSEIYNLSEHYKYSAYIAISILALLVSLLLIKIKQALIVATISFAIFILSIMTYWIADTKIKNGIAIYSGYFKQLNNKKIHTGESATKSASFVHPIGGYQVQAPNNWLLVEDKGPMFKYYQLTINNELIAEFRPRCFEKNQIALPEIVTNIRKHPSDTRLTTKVQCYQNEYSLFACNLSHITADNKIERINWLGVHDEIVKGADLDFVLYKTNSIAQDDISKIIESLKPATQSMPSVCLGLAEWF